MSLNTERLRKGDDGHYIHSTADLTLPHTHRRDTQFWIYDNTLGTCTVVFKDRLIEEQPNPVLEEGVWCEGCGLFETDEIEKDTCPACGCARTLHIPARVVRA